MRKLLLMTLALIICFSLSVGAKTVIFEDDFDEGQLEIFRYTSTYLQVVLKTLKMKEITDTSLVNGLLVHMQYTMMKLKITP